MFESILKLSLVLVSVMVVFDPLPVGLSFLPVSKILTVFFIEVKFPLTMFF